MESSGPTGSRISLFQSPNSQNSSISPERQLEGPSGRLPRSCAECSRRKIRCDRKMPCRACKERGDASLCRRRQSPRDHMSLARNGSKPELLAEISHLRRRMERVESAIGISNISPPPKNDGGGEFRENGLAGAIEEAALGIGQIRRWQGTPLPPPLERGPLWESTHPWFSTMPLSTALAALPTRQESHALVEAFCKHLNWMCGCLHCPTLRRLHNEFWTLQDQGQPQDGIFLSLLFAVLSNAAFLLDDQQMKSAALDPEQLKRSATTWFDCSFATFFRCDGLARPSLLACQAMVTLNYAFHLSGNTRIHGAMPNINIGMARAINLHLLGSSHSGSTEEIIQREMGRRVWWHLVEVEWNFTPYHRYSCEYKSTLHRPT